MSTNTTLNRKIRLAFGSAILTLIVVGGISYKVMVASAGSDRWVRHTHEVLEGLQNLLGAMETAESGARGFILTGNDSYLESYSSSIASSDQIETNVRNLTADNPVQQRHFSNLDRIAQQKIQLAQRVIDLRKARGLAAALAAVQAGAGQQLMDDYRDVIGQMQGEELRLLVLRDADAKRRLNETKAALILGTALGVLIAIGAGWSTLREHAARGLAEDTMREGEGRFRTLCKQYFSELAWMADEKGSIFWYNDRWFEYTGTTLEEMSGWGWQKSPSSGSRSAGGGENQQVLPDRRHLGRHISAPRSRWQLSNIFVPCRSYTRFGGKGAALVWHQHRHQREQGIRSQISRASGGGARCNGRCRRGR